VVSAAAGGGANARATEKVASWSQRRIEEN
jgi:hypothetical protein